MTHPVGRVDSGGADAVEVDVVVVGLGPGGEDVAGQLAEAGLSVVAVERRLVGGECPYWGCVPSKMMIRAANALAEARRVEGLAGHCDVRPQWEPVAKRIREQATDFWDDAVAARRLEGKGGRLVRGRARVVGRQSVEVDTTVFRASRALVLATGSVPAIPMVEGLAGTPFWTNHEVIELETLPSSMVVIGGGAIGMELSQVFARFGVRVSVVEAAPRVLAAEEPEVSEAVLRAVLAEGIDVHTGAGASRVNYGPEGFAVTLTDATIRTSGAERGTVSGEALLVATGRRVDLRALGVGALGVDESARALPIDERCRVAPGVWAVGDATGSGAFTHVSMYQADVVVKDILGAPRTVADYRVLPRVTFTDPEVGSFGMTERQARETGIDVAVGTVVLAATSRGWIHGPGNEGFIKVVVDRSRGVLVGGTVVGPSGGEIMACLAVAAAAAMPVESLAEMIWAYPTFSRGVLDALKNASVTGKAVTGQREQRP